MTATGEEVKRKSPSEAEDRMNPIISDAALSGTVTEDVPLGQILPLTCVFMKICLTVDNVK